MSSAAILDVKKICRVCLGCALDMKFLFKSKESPTIAQMLSELTNYKIENFSELPHLICSECLDLVVSAYKLKQQCKISHKTLLSLLDNQKNITSSNLSCDVLIKNTNEKSTQTENYFMYPCEYCDEIFFTFYTLKLHRQNTHPENLLTCRFCSRFFDHLDDLKAHISAFHPESGLNYYNQCRVCKRQFKNRIHLKNHIENIHKFLEGNWNSLEDQEIDNYGEHLTDVINKSVIISDQSDSEKEMFDVENFGCLNDEEDELPLSFLIESRDDRQITKVSEILNKLLNDNTENSLELENYIEIESDTTRREDFLSATKGSSIESLNCKYCDESYKNKLILQQHLTEKHPQVTNFSCKICSINFAHKNSLKYHLTTKHLSNCEKSRMMKKSTEKIFHCSKCEKNFSSKNSLQRHLESHNNRKRFICKECLKNFSSKEELNNHAKEEGHDKPLLCPECGLRCKSSNILTVHLRRHNGEKPFKCKFCSKGFPRIDDLKIHEKYHTGEKSHFCETCGKGFFRKYNLRIHLRVHTGEKPHKCPHCPRAFAQGNDLKAHIRRHTGERFRCEICNAAFLQGYQMRQHKLQEHGIHEIPPTQRVQKFTLPQEQNEQIKQNLQKEM